MYKVGILWAREDVDNHAKYLIRVLNINEVIFELVSLISSVVYKRNAISTRLLIELGASDTEYILCFSFQGADQKKCHSADM